MKQKEYKQNFEAQDFQTLNDSETIEIDGGGTSSNPNQRVGNNILVIGLSSILSFFTRNKS